MPRTHRIRPPDKLTELRAEAEICCGNHGHELEWGSPFRRGAARHQHGKCAKCGKPVYICGSRWPGQMDICGTAVSLDCDGCAAQASRAPTHMLPEGWLWTRRDDGRGLFFARDTRWDPSVPDLCSTSIADVARQARECDGEG